MDGVPGHHRRPGGVRPDAVGDPVGAPVRDADAAVVEAERVGADLRHRRLEALAHRRAAGEDLDAAVGVHGDPRPVGRPAAALFEEEREPGPYALPGPPPPGEAGLERVPADCGERLVEQQRVIARVQRQRGDARLVESEGAGQGRARDQVAAADLDPVDAERRGRRVDQPLADERALVAAGGAVGRRRRLVGQPQPADRAEGGHPVEAGHHAHRAVGHAGAVGAHVAALVVAELVLDRQHPPVGIDRDPGAMTLFAALVGRRQMLLPVLDPFDRAAEPPRRGQDQHVLGIELAADPEPAADMALVELDLRVREPEHPHQGFLVAVRDLGRPVQFEDAAPGVVDPERAARLQRRAGMAPGREVELDHPVGAGEGRRDVAPGMGQHRRLAGQAGGGRAGRSAGRGHRGQRGDFDLDQVGRVFRRVGVLGEDRGDRLADIAHAVAGQHRLAVRPERRRPAVGAEVDRRDVGDVGGGPYRGDARKPSRRRPVDRAQDAVGVRRAHDPHMELAGEVDVGGEAPPAGDQRPVLDARKPRADHGRFPVSSAIRGTRPSSQRRRLRSARAGRPNRCRRRSCRPGRARIATAG